ncbi:hypothetical protein K438DRAFT_1815319 [Mycena galopus ATCC 62051]|nr:hypothetical protein K438DRAFT_1815319 [Mycena galopus ATCC 62051]
MRYQSLAIFDLSTMFASPYAPHNLNTLSPRDRYVSALSRVHQAEVEYAAYLAQQEHNKRVEARQRQNEQARAARVRQAQLEYVMQQERARRLQIHQLRDVQAVKRMQMLVVHAVVSALLRSEPRNNSTQAQVERRPVEHAPKSNPSPQLVRMFGSHFVFDLTFALQQRRNHVRFVRRPETAVESSVSAAQTALKRRLASEPNVEVHATIQSILSNLSSGSRNADVVPKPTAAIQRVARAFRVLSSEFAFPSRLDFVQQPAASANYPAAKLPYTPRNGPVRNYENALNDLLSQLDAIDSEGDAVVRRQRKLVVGMVEKALEDLDRIVEGRWKLQDTQGNNTRLGPTASPAAVNDDPTIAASNPAPETEVQSQTTSTPEDECRPAPPAREPSPVSPNNGQERASQAPVRSVEVEEQKGSSQRESEIITTSDSQPTNVLVGKLELPAAVESRCVQDKLRVVTPSPLESLSVVPSSPESPSVAPSSPESPSVYSSEESTTGNPVSLSSPKSLSLAAPLPEEDLFVVDEERDNDSSSVSSWSEIED